MAVRSRCPVVVVGEGILGRGLKSEIEVSEDYRQSGAVISAVMLDIDAPETSRQNVACPQGTRHSVRQRQTDPAALMGVPHRPVFQLQRLSWHVTWSQLRSFLDLFGS